MGQPKESRWKETKKIIFFLLRLRRFYAFSLSNKKNDQNTIINLIMH